jgi:hypothetical protein
VNFGYGKEDTYKYERFITFTEAANILSFPSHSKIAELVKKQVISAYQLPLTDRVRVRKSSIMSLLKNNSNLDEPHDFEI